MSDMREHEATGFELPIPKRMMRICLAALLAAMLIPVGAFSAFAENGEDAPSVEAEVATEAVATGEQTDADESTVETAAEADVPAVEAEDAVEPTVEAAADAVAEPVVEAAADAVAEPTTETEAVDEAATESEVAAQSEEEVDPQINGSGYGVVLADSAVSPGSLQFSQSANPATITTAPGTTYSSDVTVIFPLGTTDGSVEITVPEGLRWVDNGASALNKSVWDVTGPTNVLRSSGTYTYTLKDSSKTNVSIPIQFDIDPAYVSQNIPGNVTVKVSYGGSQQDIVYMGPFVTVNPTTTPTVTTPSVDPIIVPIRKASGGDQGADGKLTLNVRNSYTQSLQPDRRVSFDFTSGLVDSVSATVTADTSDVLFSSGNTFTKTNTVTGEIADLFTLTFPQNKFNDGDIITFTITGGTVKYHSITDTAGIVVPSNATDTFTVKIKVGGEECFAEGTNATPGPNPSFPTNYELENNPTFGDASMMNSGGNPYLTGLLGWFSAGNRDYGNSVAKTIKLKLDSEFIGVKKVNIPCPAYMDGASMAPYNIPVTWTSRNNPTGGTINITHSGGDEFVTITNDVLGINWTDDITSLTYDIPTIPAQDLLGVVYTQTQTGNGPGFYGTIKKQGTAVNTIEVVDTAGGGNSTGLGKMKVTTGFGSVSSYGVVAGDLSNHWLGFDVKAGNTGSVSAMYTSGWNVSGGVTKPIFYLRNTTGGTIDINSIKLYDIYGDLIPASDLTITRYDAAQALAAYPNINTVYGGSLPNDTADTSTDCTELIVVDASHVTSNSRAGIPNRTVMSPASVTGFSGTAMRITYQVNTDISTPPGMQMLRTMVLMEAADTDFSVLSGSSTNAWSGPDNYYGLSSNNTYTKNIFCGMANGGDWGPFHAKIINEAALSAYTTSKLSGATDYAHQNSSVDAWNVLEDANKTVDVKTQISNTCGASVNGGIYYQPIPKQGENWGTMGNGAFPFSMELTGPATTDNTGLWDIQYATVTPDTNLNTMQANLTSATWGAYNAANAATYNCIRYVAKSAIPYDSTFNQDTQHDQWFEANTDSFTVPMKYTGTPSTTPEVDVWKGILWNDTSTNGALIAGWNTSDLVAARAMVTDQELAVSKAITGDTRTENQEFTFKLTPVNGTNPMPGTYPTTGGTATTTVTGPEAGTFNAIHFDTPGTYVYTINEVKPAVADSYTYDEQVYKATVTVSKNEQTGNLESSVVYTDADDAVVDTCEFTNVYTAYTPTSTTLSLSKAITGDTPATASTFNFTLTGATSDTPMPAGAAGTTATTSRSGAGNASFGAITYAKPGTYTYTVTETDDGVLGYTYDTTSYAVTVTVTAAGHTLTATPTYKVGAETKTAIAFSNAYALPTAATATFTGSKALTGDRNTASITAGEFNFSLSRTDSETGTVTGATLPATIAVGAGGTLTFPQLSFTSAGTYTFQIAETGSAPTGYTYDTKPVTATVAVTLNTTTNAYDAVVTYAKDGAAATSATFTNTYTAPDPGDATFAGSKALTGARDTASITAGEFNFSLNRTDSETGTVTGATFPLSIAVGAAGTITFPQLSFSAPGTYTFEMTETGTAPAGYTYDTKPVTITATVTLDSTNKLQTAVTYAKDGAAATSATFTNAYADPTPVKVDPPVKKTVTGDTPKTPADFTFTMSPTSGATTPMPEGGTAGTPMDKTITGAGEVEFGFATYTQVGTYTYEIAEQNTGVKGYTYDTQKYTMTVVVTLNTATNALEAVRTVTDADATEVETAEFTNSYETPLPANEDITVVKKADKETIRVGETVVYTMTVTNGSDVDAPGVWVRDYVPGYTKYVSSDGTYGFDMASNREYVDWFLTDLAAGDSRDITMTVRVDDCIPGTLIPNTALYTAYKDEPDPAKGDPSDGNGFTNTVQTEVIGEATVARTTAIARTGDMQGALSVSLLIVAGAAAGLMLLARRRRDA